MSSDAFNNVGAVEDDLAICVDSLSKIYRLGQREDKQDSFFSMIAGAIKSPISNFRKYRSLYNFDDVHDENARGVIWAVRNVSFQVQRGEVLGIIGHNGAGKSTLLKLLTRITPPTEGRIEIRGRVSSLLEVGTGFHKELTGRENIYLNGTVLGMRKQEIDRKFDEIVEFSGVERFLDTPVKRYSSGMSVRLAFSVAAHLEPEILIIDEVLAVGDAEFQRKCLTKMKEVGSEGRTVLFVSHNLPAVSNLCSRALLIDHGMIEMEGNPHDVISHYMGSDEGVQASCTWEGDPQAPGGEVAKLVSICAVSRDGAMLSSIQVDDEFGIQMVFDVVKPGRRLLPHYWFHNEEGMEIFGSLDQDPEWRERSYPLGRYTATAWIPGNLLSPGMFFISASLITRSPDTRQFSLSRVIALNVRDKMGEGTARGDWAGQMTGAVRPLLTWTTVAEAVPGLSHLAEK